MDCCLKQEEDWTSISNVGVGHRLVLLGSDANSRNDPHPHPHPHPQAFRWLRSHYISPAPPTPESWP